jgi:uncharacterized protein (TIRG00374 family)
VVGVAILLLILAFANHFIALLNKLSHTKKAQNNKLLHGVLNQINHFIVALKILHSWRIFVAVVGLSLLAWSIEGLLFVSAAYAINYDGSCLGPYFSFALGTLSTLIPSSPGYVGTFDYFTMLGIHAYGLNQTASTAYALIAHLLLWLPVTLVGFILYLKRKK